MGEGGGGDRNDEHRRYKANHPVAVAEGGDAAGREDRGDGAVDHGVQLGDGLAQEDGHHHQQQAADFRGAEVKVGAVGKTVALGGQVKHQKGGKVTGHHAPSQHLLAVLHRKEHGGDDAEVQGGAYHPHRKVAAVDLKIPL